MQIRKGRSIRKRAGITVLLIAVVVLFFAGVWKEVSLEQAQRDLLAMLETNAGNYNEDRVVLSSTNRREAREMTEAFGGSLRITDDGSFAVIRLPEGVVVHDIAQSDDYRKYHDRISLDYNNFAIVTADTDMAADGDIRANFQTDEPMYPQQTYLNYINIGDSWNVSMGKNPNGEKVTVAIIDSGIDTDHPEFTDADGNSIISMTSYDATDDKVVSTYGITTIEDEHGHGTAVAGVIASQINGSGIMGVAPDVELLVIKCDVDKTGKIKYSSDLAFGIFYAIEQDVDVINMSWGTDTPDTVLNNAIQLAVDSDIITVASAGNDSTAKPHYPAAFDMTIGVGALATDSWELAAYSNYGDNSDIMAPGTTLTTAKGGGYATENGTSMATPVVSAAVAIYRSQHPYATFEQVKNDLLAAGKDLGELGEDMYFGFGALDMNAFICEEKGLITYDYCTEDLETTTQVFVKQHTIQTVPEPERENIIFDDWYYDKGYTRVFDYDTWYTTEFIEDVTLYAKWVNEDDEGASVYSYKTLDDGTIEITSYKGKRRYLTVPNEIDGMTVSSIGISAFAGNTRLREVTLPEGLTTIREYAFSGVSSLREVTFTGTGLKSIEQRAFQDCMALRKLELPDSVMTIGLEAFMNCSALSAVEITENSELVSIGGKAFSKTALSYLYLPSKTEEFSGSVLAYCTKMRNVEIHADNTAFKLCGSAVLSADGTVLVYYPAALTEALSVPEGVVKIGSYACTSSYMYQVTLPESLEQIGACSFASAKLSQVHIPAKVQNIKAEAFRNCIYLAKLTFAEDAQLQIIDERAFEMCTLLSELELPKSLVKLGDSCFCECNNITELYIPENVTEIERAAFFGCKRLETVTFADNCAVRKIPEQCFSKCGRLHTVTFSDGVESLGSSAFHSNFLLNTLIFGTDSALSSVDDSCFYGCSALNQMQLPETVTSIGKYAYAFSSLTSVHVPANLTSIGDGAFGACYLLNRITVDAGHTVYAAVDNVLFNKDITAVYCVPSSRMGSYTLPDTVQIIAPYSFYYDKLLTEVILPEGLQEIQHDSFYSCSSLQSIAIPGTVTNIGRMGFSYCHSLSNISFGENSQLQRLGLYTFVNCAMSEITIPASVETMAQCVFGNCAEMKRITFASGSKLSYVAAYLLSGTQIEEVVFEEGSALTQLQAHAFDGAKYLKTVDFGDAALETIDNYAFYNCTNLEQITIPETVTYLGRYAFYGCAGLGRMDISAAMDYIGMSAFNGTNSMKVFFVSDTLPANVQAGWDEGIAGYFLAAKEFVVTDEWEYIVTYSGNAALARYTGSAAELAIDTVDGYRVEKIGAGCFEGNDTLTAVMLSASVREIDNYAFRNSVAVVTIPADSVLERIGNHAFSGNATESLTLPDTVTHIGAGAFEGSGLKELTIRDSSCLQIVGDRAFCGSGIESIYLPDALKTIGVEAFKDASALSEVTIAKGETELKLSNAAFEGSCIAEITIPARVSYIGEYTFGSCQNLQNIHVDDTNSVYQDLDGVLLDGSGTTLIQYPCGRKGAYEIPAQITVLNYASFKNAGGLTEVTFAGGSTVKTIGWQTFSGCESLTKITVPDTVISFDFYAFENCTSLTEVVLGEGNQLAGIYEGAFYGCTNLTGLHLPDTVIDIGDYAFCGCTDLTKFPLSENAQTKGIGAYAFDGCTGITVIPKLDCLIDVGEYAFAHTAISEFTVPAVLTEISEYSFFGCNGLMNVYCDEENLDYVSIDGVLFEKSASGDYDALVVWPFGREMLIGEGKTELTKSDTEVMNKYSNIKFRISDSITKIGDYAFSGYRNIRSITLPEQITAIGKGAFEACLALEHINIPSGVTSIGQGAFSRCINLVTAGPEGSGCNMELGKIETIPADAFYGCELVTIEFPESVKRIESYAFVACNRLKAVTIPSSVTVMRSISFYLCPKLERIEFNATNMTRGISPFVLAGTETDGIDVIFGKNVQTIPAWLFDDSQVQVLGFTELVSIKSVTFEEGSVCTKIGSAAFKNCEKLTSFVIPESVVSVGGGVFEGCTGLSSAGPIGSGCNIEFGWKETIPNSAFSGHDALRSIVIPDTVTSIGNYAFSECTALSQIDLPDALTTLGERVFKDCTGLTKVTIPGGVSNMEIGTFVGCTELKSAGPIGSGCNIEFGWDDSIPFDAFYGSDCLERVIIPEGITGAGRYAFRGCTNLSYVQLPESLTTFGSSVFMECPKLTTAGPVGSGSCIEYGWKDMIPDYAFQDAGLSGIVTIPDGITCIGMCSFMNCNEITWFYLPSSLKTVHSQAFDTDSKVMIVYDSKVAPDSLDILKFGRNPFFYNVAYFGETEDGYSYCAMNDDTVTIWDYTGAEVEMVIPEEIDGMPVVDLNNSAFSGKEITSAIIPSRVHTIGSRAFLNCTSLKTITIGRGVTTLGSNVFNYCRALETVNFHAVDMENQSYSNSIFYGAGLDSEGITFVFGSDVQQIPAYLTASCSARVKEIVFAEDSSCEQINNYAFAKCAALTSVTIPERMTKIGTYAFKDCTGMRVVRIDSPVIALSGSSASSHGYLTNAAQTLVVPAGISLSNYYIDQFPQTELLEIDGKNYVSYSTHTHDWGEPEILSVWSECVLDGISAYTCGTCGLVKQIVEEAHDMQEHILTEVTCLTDGCAYSECSRCGYRMEYIIEAAGAHQFSDWYTVEEATEDSVGQSRRDCANCSYYETGAFTTIETGTCGLFVKWYLTGQGRLVLYGHGDMQQYGSSKDVPWYSFCESITSAEIGQGITSIGPYAFFGCSNLISVEVPDTVKSIEYNAFYNCSSLISVEIPDAVKNIGSYAFRSCRSLTSVEIPASVTSIGTQAFSYCYKLSGIVVDEENTAYCSIGGVLFNKNGTTLIVCPAGYSGAFTIPDSVTSISGYAFGSCLNLTSVEIPYGVTSIGSSAFYGCSSLTSIEIPSSVTGIDRSVFESCSKLASVEIPDSITSIGDSAFYQCSRLTSVEIPDSVTSIGSSAFYQCKSLTSVKIPCGVTSISSSTFYGCTALTSVTIPDSITRVENYAFYNCSALTAVEIPEGVTDIGAYAFYNCRKLNKLEIPSSVTSIAYNAFDNCVAVKHVIFTADAPTVGSNAFRNVIANVFYPINNETWTDSVKQNYGGTLTWLASCDDHVWGTWIVSREATCSEAGMEQRNCQNCMVFETRDIPAAGHNFESAVTAPTCTEQGFITHTCSTCGDSYADTYVDALGHDMGEWTTVTEASCTGDGSERRDCSRCDHYENRVIKATGHSFGAWFVNRSAACTGDGENRRNCNNCSHYETEIIPATGHDCESVVTAPTCTEQGYTTHTCTVCGDSYVDTYANALGHDMGKWQTVTKATCTEDGSERRDCSRCDHDETRTIEATGHSYEAVVTAPTCTEQGFTTHTCRCGDSYVDTYVDALGHDMGKWQTVTKATCTEDGSERRDCSRCDHDETRTIEATGHSYEAVVTAPTCTEQGFTTHTCANCGDSYVDTYVNALGHDMGEWTTVTEATCTEDGSERRDCSRCDHHETLTIEATGHNYEAAATAPTCTEQGFVIHTCSNCGDSYVDTYVDVLGHDMGEWTTVTEATCTEDGSERRDCSRCDHHETRIIEATGHSFGDWFVNRSATCTRDGENRRNCSNCSHYETEVIPATGHNYKSVVTAPTCTKQGFTTHTCTACGDTYVDTYVDAPGHDYEVVIEEPTCTEDGLKTQSCIRCGDVVTEVLPGGHEYVDGVCIRCGDGMVTVASGWSGDTTWTLTNDGVITFSGEGTMRNYTYKSEMPWYSYFDQITAVVIEEGVTSIGSYAFYGMDIESIEIASTVTAIGDYAFKNAKKLDGVILPEGLTRLGESVFYECTSLTAIEIPASLWTIQPYTFKNCTALAEVTFNEGNLQKISDGAFYNTAVTELVLPDCLDILDVYSFKNCADLESITLGSGLSEIREAVFYGTAISEIFIPEGITRIGPYAFKNCVDLEAIELPASLTRVDEAGFYACTALKSVEFPDNVTKIGNYAFRKCEALEAVTFGEGLADIGESSFYGCTSLTELLIPDSVTTIQSYAFKACTGLTGVTLGEGLTTIGDSAFHTCTGLKSLVFPASVEKIGEYCFSSSYNLWQLTFLGDAPAIGAGAFKGLDATAWYPGGNATWTSAVRQNYGGTIIWKAR